LPDAPNNYDRVAPLYDRYVRTTLDIPFFVREARGARVLELMAGTGRVTQALVAPARRVTCVDSSPAMLRVLAERFEAGTAATVPSPAPRVACCDVRALPFRGPFDLTLIPFNSLAEVLDPADRHRTLREVWRTLAPSGRFVCTLHNPAVRLLTLDGAERPLGTFDLPGGRRLEVTAEGSHDGSGLAQSSQRYRIVDLQSHLAEEFRQDVLFALISREEMEAAADQEGFELLALYGDYDESSFDARSSPFMIWRFRRRPH
jgi:SAM-dependent methyltransferase